MNAAEILAKLTQQGVLFWAENSKLNIRSPKGVITPEIQIEIATYKEDILALIQEMNVTSNYAHEPLIQGISLQTIGKLVGGFSGESPTGYQPPIINPQFMAENLKITFRPLPDNYYNHVIVRFRQQLMFYLQKHGVKVIPWKEATTELKHTIKIPIINLHKSLKMPGVRADIDAVIDVERPNSWLRKLGIFVAETWYKLSYTWLKEKQQMSVIQIAKLSSWAEDHAAKYVEDPTNTQVVILTDIDDEFVNPLTPYAEKIRIGINTLVKTFSEIVIGVSDEKFSILNMNLSDSKFAPSDMENFALKSLIPKVFVPITPLLISRFELGEYNPHLSNYAEKLVKLGQELASTGLFPAGFKLDEVIKRKSHRDIVNVIVNGRTGVSYGFVAYAEPPHYVGKPEITIDEWENLLPVVGFSNYELRQNEQGRRYIKLNINAENRFKQIPDIWLVSSRSGANKTDLNIDSDILRIGLQDKLHLQLPLGSSSKKADIKPSYDIYVMLAISLAAALYTPELIANGAPIVHFHGYPDFDWFQENEYCVGVNNPSVPCGTYESGVFNFLGIADLGEQIINDVNLISLVEPDHGTNFIASDLEYLVTRLKAGCVTGQIELGGKNFPSLKNRSVA
ncbi:MAG: non-ribosomal peptide synthase [Dolichospermum sp. DET50]|nr:non-ribosomal peptide synthase [Dolichospermum sp. DET66]MBS3032840.1 non-ribosomal peptide synthase [Dolichospermum sp. DET67]MBS3038046.1 non-ribosomal peptide synthase [Dolichospermum sp. DET50]QSX69955.1 MAG: non-ribosomal peptide synthase [Dolichospermum sp. DET69]